MKFIHTFWSKPLLNNKFNKMEILLPVTINQYAYSAECVHNLNHKIVLFADEIGAELLSCIPYDEVIIVPNLENESVHFAAQLKFYALEHSDLGDCIIDGDLFIRSDKVLPILNKPVDCIYSFFEPTVYTLPDLYKAKCYYDLVQTMNKIPYEKPYVLPVTLSDVQWMNTSLIKINSQSLKDEYIKQYYHHKKLLDQFEFTTWPDIIIEQRFLTLLVSSKNYTSSPIVEGFAIDPNANQVALDLGFTHLGSGKVAYNEWIQKLFYESNKTLYNKTVQHIKKMWKKYNKYSSLEICGNK